MCEDKHIPTRRNNFKVIFKASFFISTHLRFAQLKCCQIMYFAWTDSFVYGFSLRLANEMFLLENCVLQNFINHPQTQSKFLKILICFQLNYIWILYWYFVRIFISHLTNPAVIKILKAILKFKNKLYTHLLKER